MDYTEKRTSREVTQKMLEKAKAEELNTVLWEKRISPTTIVCCKRKERLEEYDKIYNKKITIDNYGR